MMGVVRRARTWNRSTKRRHRKVQFIAVYSLSHLFALNRIPVHLFLRITAKSEDERPHEQSCAGEGDAFSLNTKTKGRIDVGRYPVQAQD
ncbi:MAG: hypothetical protein J0I81_03015, partial [Hyphomicrobium sp.]|nr:hypothetical protein [Hyphomicrobium sp.]